MSCLGHEACSVMWLRSDFHAWHEKRLAIIPRDMNQADCTNSTTRLPHPVTLSALLSSASCLTEAEPCAPHSSASWVSVSPERHGWRGLWWKSGGSLHHWPGSLHEGAKSMGSIRTSHLWHAYPSRILCKSEDLGSCGWALPSLISLLSRAVGADADDPGGWRETPVSTVRAVCPVDPRSSYWHWYSSSLSPEVSPGLDLDLKAQCEVWELEVGPLSAISLMRGEQETAAHRPSPTSWLLASPTGP